MTDQNSHHKMPGTDMQTMSLDKKLGEDASMEEKKDVEKSGWLCNTNTQPN